MPKPRRKLRLYVALVLPFVLQVLGTAGIVGYLSFRNSQAAIYDLASQLMNELTLRIRQETRLYVEMPFLINSVSAIALMQGDLRVAETEGEYLLWQQLQAFPSTNLIYCATEDGAFMGVGYANEDQVVQLQVSSADTDWFFHHYELTPQGNRGRLRGLGDRPYDPRIRPWYQAAREQGKPVWSEVYLDFDALVPVITASTPVYDPTSQALIGVCATDFLLTVELDSFLHELSVGESGETFIIEHTGNLVASSIPDDDILFFDETNSPTRLQAVDMDDPLIRETSRELVARFGDFQSLTDGQFFTMTLGDRGRQFVQIEPFRDDRGLNWLVVVVIPVSDFMAQVHTNTWQTAALSVGAVGLAIVIGLVTSRHIARPILSLNRAATAIAQGDLDQAVEVNGIEELEQLGSSFNQMAQRLQDAIATLEQRVAERTADLEESNQKLEIEKERAESANRAKSAFIANMSHELRSPLNAVLGFSQLMIRSGQLPPAQLDHASTIYRSGDYLLTLINNILDLSKIEANKVILNPRDVDLYRLLGDVDDMLHLRAEHKGLQLTVTYDKTLPRYIHVDDVKLQQVLINLLSNGIKFTEQGWVRLAVTLQAAIAPTVLAGDRPEGAGVAQAGDDATPGWILRFEVSDTGVGIAEEELPTLFSAFTQTQSGRTLQEGTGLGLHISRKFVRLMGGEMTLQSQLHHGTTITFTLPTTPAETTLVPELTPTNRVLGLVEGQPTYRLLVVDDKAVNRQLLVKLLTPIGFEVREAANGQEAIAVWQDWQPHLIWMDMRMPVMDGYAATQQIKATPHGQSTVIIALTASVLEEEQVVIRAAGCDDFLRKPFKESVIFDAIARHLGVRYRYAEDLPPGVHPQTAPDPSWCDRLVTLPPDWLQDFYQAVLEADGHTALTLLEQLPPDASAIAQPLTAMVNQFQFESILVLLDFQPQDEPADL
jgi:signal transduction histidine kinase/ActR/RegA family two-component response regulator